MALCSPRIRRAAMTATCGTILIATLATPALAIPDWRKDGRLGYATRAEAMLIAKAFVAKGAPREGMDYVIFRDPDGGFTPVFHEKPAEYGPGA